MFDLGFHGNGQTYKHLEGAKSYPWTSAIVEKNRKNTDGRVTEMRAWEKVHFLRVVGWSWENFEGKLKGGV